jgi:shikimate dehydrogenase
MSDSAPPSPNRPAKEQSDKAHCGIVLHPAGHTRSPAMHRAAYRTLGLEADYQAYDVPPEGLAEAVNEFRARGLRQFAVSIPHKESMLSLVDEVEPVAAAIGAINTVTRVDGRWVGTNTDWIGAIRALERVIPVGGQRAVVLGAGGAARALVYALRKRDCDVIVLNRTRARAHELVRDLGGTDGGGLETLGDWTPEILVNTTNVGLGQMTSPVSRDSLGKDMVVLDAVYSPERTQLLLDAEARSARTIGGKWMLVYQAIEQLRLWTRLLENPPGKQDFDRVTDIMAQAFDEAGR